MTNDLIINVEFGGGAELLFDKVKRHVVSLPGSDRGPEENWTLGRLLQWIRDNLIKQRPELLTDGKTVRPGILVLVNDTDWELLGEADYVLKPNDTVTFISTLHGG